MCGLVRGSRGIMRGVGGPRVIVVGAGVYGLGAARRLALAGADVTVLEAREAGGPFAASAGSSRVLRFEYGAAAHYTDLVLRARTQWRELERLLGERCTTRRGMLWFAIELSQYLDDSLETCESAGLPVLLLEPAEAARRFPAFSVEGVAAVLHDAAGGVLHARRATLGMARLAARRARRCARAPRDRRRRRRRRARRRHERDRRPGARRDGRVDGRAARGSHPLDAAGQRLPAASRRPACPCGRTTSTSTASATHDGAGLKVGGHAVGPDVDRMIRRRARLRRPRCSASPTAARRRLPGLGWPDGGAPIRGADVCCYALTPTEAPIVDRIGERTVVCAGFSGHGFKFAPTVAAAAADLVLGRTPEIDLAPFRSPSQA